MTYKFFSGCGELPVLKVWTKSFDKDLPKTVKLEYNPQTRQVTAMVQVAIITKRAMGETKTGEFTYPISRAEVLPMQMPMEAFAANKASLKAQIVANVYKNFITLSMNGGNLWP